jgi:hypothetical protein
MANVLTALPPVWNVFPTHNACHVLMIQLFWCLEPTSVSSVPKLCRIVQIVLSPTYALPATHLLVPCSFRIPQVFIYLFLAECRGCEGSQAGCLICGTGTASNGGPQCTECKQMFYHENGICKSCP